MLFTLPETALARGGPIVRALELSSAAAQALARARALVLALALALILITALKRSLALARPLAFELLVLHRLKRALVPMVAPTPPLKMLLFLAARLALQMALRNMLEPSPNIGKGLGKRTARAAKC